MSHPFSLRYPVENLLIVFWGLPCMWCVIFLLLLLRFVICLWQLNYVSVHVSWGSFYLELLAFPESVHLFLSQFRKIFSHCLFTYVSCCFHSFSPFWTSLVPWIVSHTMWFLEFSPLWVWFILPCIYCLEMWHQRGTQSSDVVWPVQSAGALAAPWVGTDTNSSGQGGFSCSSSCLIHRLMHCGGIYKTNFLKNLPKGFSYEVFALVFSGCHSKISQITWLKQ